MGAQLLMQRYHHFFFTLPNEVALRCRADAAPTSGVLAQAACGDGQSGAPQPISALEIAAAVSGTGRQGTTSGSHKQEYIDTAKDVGRLLQSLLRSAHFKSLGESDEAVAQQTLAQADADQSTSLSAVVAELRTTWVREVDLGAQCGLLDVFREPRHANTRAAYINLCDNLDRVVFFLVALRPYHRLAGQAGDVSMIRLRKSLGHLLQELETAVVEIRQARLEVTRATKKHLQELAKKPPASGSEQYKWMQCLRHIDERQLDAQLQEIVAKCAELRAATTAEREIEMKNVAGKQLADVANVFMSADFQARGTLRLPDKLATDMKALANSSGQGSAALPGAASQIRALGPA